ncbi:HupE/UreJ family protein [Ramlibacter tataouinensis]|uniref:Candidate membrane protein n=1 Tax=Ramlibacter tataouinensis (strain ATCC BAA-407 / DSM 14655 / LMG 21543 / TTB310) TaxID=365046 RepID=F5XZ52_RAMTT|nr:HupE/UreJ family protein [Ramlibacter tataouinensis]AEG93222.1 candidate membrane protein [Ramlibacter tataouinensis TTB310]
MKRLLLTLAVWLLAHGAALAHKPSDSYLSVQAGEDRSTLTIRWDIALRDLDYVLQLDRDGNGELTWGEVRSREADIQRLASGRLSFVANGQPCPWSDAAPLQLDRHSDGTYAVLGFAAQCGPLAQGLTLRYSLLFDVDPTHRGLVQWRAPGEEQPQPLVFAVDSAEQPLSLEAPSAWETLRQYVWEGVWHIWIGFDHILFLLALLLPAVLRRQDGRWQPVDSLRAALVDVVKVVTAFTLAHSITLSLAALGLVSLPSRLVESVIAASVVVAALANLRGGRASRRRWLMAFIFGLIHGFGFASVLADLGLPQNALVLALVGFNVGVELGQLAIVAVFLPLAFALRRTGFYRVGVLQVGSLLIALVALWWFVERAFDL